ncbi:MAG: hypothetical protein JWP87_1106 [Labilithrix sp.]|nr:hypothetical protein [Labilithrix sp.]
MGRPTFARVAIVSFVVSLGLAVSARAKADTPSLPLELTWDVPAECPPASHVERRVAQILQGPPPAKSIVVAVARIRRADDSGRFELSLSIRTGDVEESRTIDAASCSALAEASAVVIALAINPEKESPAETPPSPTPASTAMAPIPPLVPRPPQPPRPPRYHYALGLGAAVDSGTLPDVGAGMLASIAVRIDRVRLGVLSTLWFRQEPTFDASGQAGASFDMIAAGAFGGYMVALGPVALGPVANLEATFVRVRGFGIRTPRASWTGWPTAVLGGRAELRVSSWLGLFARADAAFAVAAPTFTLGNAESGLSLHSPAIPAARLGFGAEIVIP